MINYFLCTFWEGNKSRLWARYKLALSTSAITFMVCNNIFLSVLSVKICCLEVILSHLLIIYPFQRKQNPLRCMDTVLQMCSHKRWLQRNNYFLQPAGCILAQCPESCCLLLRQNPKSFPTKLLSDELDCSLYWYMGFFLPKGRIWLFIELQSDHSSSLLRSLCYKFDSDKTVMSQL